MKIVLIYRGPRAVEFHQVHELIEGADIAVLVDAFKAAASFRKVELIGAYLLASNNLI